MKNGRAHCVPIFLQVASLLKYLRYSSLEADKNDSENPDKDFVFRSLRRRCLSSRTIHQTLQRVNKASGLKHFTAHDLRRTCATGLRRIGIPRETVSRILNHTNRSVTLVYDWYDELPEIRSALNACGEQIENLSARNS